MEKNDWTTGQTNLSCELVNVKIKNRLKGNEVLVVKNVLGEYNVDVLKCEDLKRPFTTERIKSKFNCFQKVLFYTFCSFEKDRLFPFTHENQILS